MRKRYVYTYQNQNNILGIVEGEKTTPGGLICQLSFLCPKILSYMKSTTSPRPYLQNTKWLITPLKKLGILAELHTKIKITKFSKLEQHTPRELAVMMKTFSICNIQLVATSRATVTKEVKSKLKLNQFKFK